MFEPNAVMSIKDCPEVRIPVKVFLRPGIKGETFKEVWTEKTWDDGVGEAYRLELKHRQPKALYQRTTNGMVKQSRTALNNFVLTK